VANTAVDICNLALARIGQRQFIGSLTDPSTAGQLCNVLYAPARDATLASAPWQFATKRATLAAVAGQTWDGWGYGYALPTDFVAVRYLYPGVRAPTLEQRIPYSLEYSGSVPVLLTDQSPALLVYICNAVPEVLFPPLFVQAVAWKLAAELALGLPEKSRLAVAMENAWRAALGQAIPVDANQSQGDVEADSEIITSR
jgi:hypothetical protein